MRGTRVEIRLGVVVRALVLVLDEKADGRAKGDTILNTGLNLDEVRLVAL